METPLKGQQHQLNDFFLKCVFFILSYVFLKKKRSVRGPRNKLNNLEIAFRQRST